MTNKKIAIFFDCENISAKYTDEIFNELAKIGEITIKKAYHNWSTTQTNSWQDKIQEFAIEPIQVFPSISGKNSIDIKLTIDVVNTTIQPNIDVIVLVSSDSDFTTLAMDIKSKGFNCIGFGEEKTPLTLRKAFTEFFELPRNIIQKEKAIEFLKEAIIQTKDYDDFSNIAMISQYLINKDSSLTAKNFGIDRWSDFIKEETNYFIYEYRTNKSKLMVKIK
jgi:uncharacterized protein (TIGR00288 family)